LEAIAFGVEEGCDWFAASFIRGRGDVEAVRRAIEEAGGDQPVVSKVEHAEAVFNLSEIVEASDGVMVARGDLGVEMPPCGRCPSSRSGSSRPATGLGSR